MRSINECAASNSIYVGTADSIFVLQFYLCLSTITEVPCVDTVAWIRPLQIAVRGPPNLQNTKLARSCGLDPVLVSEGSILDQCYESWE